MSEADTLARLAVMSAEGDGGLTINTFTQDQYMALAHRAKAGDAMALRLFTAAGMLMDEIAADGPDAPPRSCDCCDQPLAGHVSAIGVVTAAVEVPQHYMSFTVCTRCGVTDDAILAAAAKFVRGIWPGARPITITHENGGRA